MAVEPNSNDDAVDELDVLHYDNEKDVPQHLLKYWYQRYDIFSKYDEGVQLTNNAWFGVTPEPVADQIATDIATRTPPACRTLIDAFAGAGGNTIAFARSGRWDHIVAVERDPATAACARRNAQVYGVADRITWLVGDCFALLSDDAGPIADACAADGGTVIFASPPWGGPKYTGWEVFDVERMEPYPLRELRGAFRARSERVVLFLPRTANLNQLAAAWRDADADGGKLMVRHYCMTGFSKGLCVFYGKWEKAAQDG